MTLPRRGLLQATLAAPTVAAAEAAAQPGPQPAPAAPADGLLRLTFLHVNDVYRHAPLDGRGGLAELGTLLERARAAAPGPVITTFGGDLISPSLASSVTEGAHMIGLLNALGAEVAVLGNHEFDFGPEVAARRIAESRFPWLGANVLGADGGPFGGAAATHVIEAGGLKVGFVGVLTGHTATLSRATGITFAPEQATLAAAAAALRRDGADLVVALTHVDLEDDRRMAREVAGLDLVLGGHDHEPSSHLEGRPLVLKAGSDADWLAVVELAVRPPAPGRPARVQSVGWRFVPVQGVPPAAAIVPLVAAVEARLESALGAPLATLAAPLDSRTGTVRTREAALGDLVADALREHLSADVALINGGGLRGNREYPVGHVLTRRDLRAEMPFLNAVVALELSGAELLTVLEHGLGAVEDASGRFPQVSGLALAYEPRAPAGRRLRAVAVGGQPLDPARRYRLATTDYLQRGGDGYPVLPHARVLVDASGGPLLVNVASEAAARLGTIRLVPDGRIRVAGG